MAKERYMLTNSIKRGSHWDIVDDREFDTIGELLDTFAVSIKCACMTVGAGALFGMDAHVMVCAYTESDIPFMKWEYDTERL